MIFEFKDKYTVNDLIDIIKILRSPNGCPWDKEQTHKSIRQNFIEEVYEALEAINNDDKELLREELGDVLMQVVFHADIERESGNFNFDDVADEVCKKLIIRHPHVFSDTEVSGKEEVLKKWDAIKMKTKSQTTKTDAMKSVSRALPALMRSRKVLDKAGKVNFNLNDFEFAIENVIKLANKLLNTVKCNESIKYEEELGDLLFSVVNVSRYLDVDSETSLSNICDKFIKFNQNIK